MKPEFHQDFQSPRRDPMDARSVDFPWDEVFARLDGEPMPDEVMGMLSDALGEMIEWIAGSLRGAKRLEVVISRRAIAMAWVIRPQMFEGSPSLRTLAKRLRVPLRKLSRQAAAVSRDWGVRNRAQSPQQARRGTIDTHPGKSPSDAPTGLPGTLSTVIRGEHEGRAGGRGQAPPLPSPGKESFFQAKPRGSGVTPQTTRVPPKSNVP